MVTEQEINSAFQVLDAVTGHLEAASRTETELRAELEVARDGLLLGGLIDGKNAEIRDAQMRDALGLHHDNLARAQAETARCRAQLTGAQIEVDRCKTLLRLLDVIRR